MNITIGELLIIMGIPSAVTGLAVWALKRFLDKRDKEAEKRDAAMMDILISQMQCSDAALSLAEATANAVSRIPDAPCNGDMHDALQMAKDAKKKQAELLTKLSVGSAVV